MIYNIVDIM